MASITSILGDTITTAIKFEAGTASRRLLRSLTDEGVTPNTTSTEDGYGMALGMDEFDYGIGGSDTVEIGIGMAGEHYTQTQQMSLSVIERIAGALSILGGLHIFWRAWNRRRCGFDRIMLGLSIHTILLGIFHLWGSAAIPAGTQGIYGAHGTTATCTAQGFLFQISMVVPFYYVFLSCYAWAVVMYGNFDPARYEWIEKYIHLGVHIFPIASAVYLFKIEAFNSNGLHCWIASIPSGCGGNSGIECLRGPQNPGLILWIFGGIPAVFFVAFPTIVMGTLTYCVYLRQQQGCMPCVIPPWMVARQSAVYLGSLYWVYVPLFVFCGLCSLKHTQNFGVSLWVSLVTFSMGLWFSIVYWYFSTEDPTFACDGCDGKKLGSSATHTDCRDSTEPVVNESTCEESNDDVTSITSVVKARSRRSSNRWRISVGDSGSKRTSKRFSFNIFDGTASSGMFSDFVFEGDSDDEEKDLAESKQWEHCQSIIMDS